MKKVRNILMCEMYACIAISVTIITLFETGTLIPGFFECDTTPEFLTVTFMEILTICMIPLALRLFKFKKISAALVNDGGKGLTKWGSVRMMMLCVPMAANTLLYYLFDKNVAFGYMAIICLVCLIFIYPSPSRCISETGGEQ